MPSYLVIGATGQQGGATARELLKQNATIHALVRSVSSPAAQELQKLGCILFPGSWDDVPAISAAVQGVTGVFVNSFPDFTDPDNEVRQVMNIVNEAKKAGTVETVVVTTAFKVGMHETWVKKDPEYPLAWFYRSKTAIEEAVKTGGFRYWTVLRPAWLMHNYVAPVSQWHFPELEAEQTLATGYQPSAVMPQFDAYDVGKFAAAAFLEPARFDKRVIELGNEHPTIDKVAKLLTRVSGVEVKTRRRGADEFKAMAAKVPSQPFHLLANDSAMNIDAEALKKYGIPLITLEQYLERHKVELLKALGAGS